MFPLLAPLGAWTLSFRQTLERTPLHGTTKALAGFPRSKKIRMRAWLGADFPKKLGLKKRVVGRNVSAKKIVASFFHVVDKALLLLLETDTHPKLSSHGQMVTMAEGGSIATRSHSWKQSTFNENVVVLVRPVVSHVLPSPDTIFNAATGRAKMSACRVHATIHQPRFQKIARRIDTRVTMTTTNRSGSIIFSRTCRADADTAVGVHRQSSEVSFLNRCQPSIKIREESRPLRFSCVLHELCSRQLEGLHK